MTYENLRFEVADGIATLTLTREKALNALNTATNREIGACVAQVAGDSSIRALILTGAGEKAFAAGADIAEMQALSAAEAERLSRVGHEAFGALEKLSIVTIAAVNGFCLGGGCELAMACDLIYASSKARFGQPEVNLGVIPGFGGTQRLARRVGLQRAKELLFTGDVIGAVQAKAIGLALEVLEPEQLMPHCLAVARKIASKGPLAVAQCKRLVEEGADLTLAEACDAESKQFGALFGTRDQAEGMAAFLEKRPAVFQGN